MIGRRLAMLVLGITLLASGSYVAVYLVRWEWQRATFSAMVFLSAEMALVALWLGSRLKRVGARPAPGGVVPDQAPAGPELLRAEERRIRAALAAARPRQSNPFSWLDPTRSQAGVFIPLLLGAGVLFSALAWLVERVAAAAAGPAVVASMAAGLAALQLPERLVPPPADPDWAYRPGGWSDVAGSVGSVGPAGADGPRPADARS